MATNTNDKRFTQLTLAIQKAINSIETPVKEKHVRSAIIGTFQEQSAITYWMVAVRLPLQDNRIVAWKFCHVTHKLLREGHPACLDDSQRHISMIENLGRLWVHLREGYGKLVNLYCSLLVCKLKFHSRNPHFPGNMQLTADELDAIAENDVNNYFQLCVELFDYLDDILNLQAAVFDSLGNARANSMTASGQCRLAALIPCAQDSSHIYDCNVRLLFRLHASLPADTLAGHRERFRQQFKKLSSFYKHASSLQYYRNLLTLPVLPSNPPNFLLQSDFGTYVTPVVTIPEPAPDELDAVGSLVDTSDTLSRMTPEHVEECESRAAPSPSTTPQPDPVLERDRLIDHLQNELKRMRAEVSQLVQERNTMLSSMREHCTRLESQLQATKTELEEEKHKVEILSVQAPEIKQKLTETEEKAKVTDEKFQKLKGAYTQLREEHIALIRQKAEVDKLSASLRAAAGQHESAKLSLQQQLNDRIKDVEILQQSASSSEEIEAYKTEISNLRSDVEQARQKEVELETVKASMEALEIEHKTATVEQQEKLTTISNELKETTETLEAIKREKDDKEIELSRVKEELVELREMRGDEYKKIVEEKETAINKVNELTQQFLQEKEEQVNYIHNLQTELENFQQKIITKEISFASQCQKLSDELTAKNHEFEETLRKKDSEIKQALDRLVILEQEIRTTKINYETSTQEKLSEVNDLQKQINDLVELQNNNKIVIKELETELINSKLKLDEITCEKVKIEEELSKKVAGFSNLESKITEVESISEQEVTKLNEGLREKNIEIIALEKKIEEMSSLTDKQESECIHLQDKIIELETIIENKSKDINDFNSKLNEAIASLDKQNIDHENNNKEHNYQKTILKDKLQNITECKDEIINNLKSMIAEKDEQVIVLNVEVTKLSEDVARLTDELKETNAELEIGNNELFTLREEYESIIDRNESNLALKNQELRSLHNEINKLTAEKNNMETEKELLIEEFALKKQVLEDRIKEIEYNHNNLTIKYDTFKNEKEAQLLELKDEINKLNLDMNTLKCEKDKEVETLTVNIETKETRYAKEILKKDEKIAKSKNDIEQLKVELEDMKKETLKEKEDLDLIVTERDNKIQILEARLAHIESEKLNAECELQDLLQHNTVLEADLAAVKKQLEETQKELENKSSRLVSCAGEASLQVTTDALAALDRPNAQDSNKAAAELAAKALEDLAACTQVKGNEETVARSAIFTAHNTAQLSAYVTEVSNISTDMELSDKLNTACRSMLSATKQCLESLGSGTIVTSSCSEAQAQVASVARAAAAADRDNTGARSVDDELADMDAAIEHAASQIEEMLAASRAGDSGVKLEVNGKILDACTTLMGAVKILVQDARKLQNELGDPKTRQKMYRKNPQWSEGLISAAKAVVFAAKLLVTSADESVGGMGSGRVEGVSAAAHEVAGSTAQLVAASRARAPPAAPALARLTRASRSVAAATGALVAAVRAGSALVHEQEALDTSALTLTATRRLEMESKVRSLELESALDAERARLAALRKRHYHLAQMEENGNMTNGKE